MSPADRPDSEVLLDDLRSVVGPAHVLHGDATTSYTTDWTRRWSGPAACVVRPADTAQVADVVRVCAAHGAAIVPQGGNTGLVGGSVPRGGEMVLSLTRLDGLDEVDLAAGQVTAGAGVTIAALDVHARAAGLAYGVDLASRDTATVGGTIATNAGGVRVVRYGDTRRQVAGVEAVLADGSVLDRLAGLEKDNVGYDLPGLLVGSEGTLGIVTRARLRLVSPPTHRVTALLALDGVAAAVEVAGELRRALDGLEAVELVTHDGVELVVARAGVARPFVRAHPACLLVEVGGRTDPTEAVAEVLGTPPLADVVREVAVATDRPARERLWRVREAHTEAIATLGVAHKLDVALPPAALAAFHDALPAVLARVAPGAQTFVFGHLADGNLHVNVVGPAPDDEAVDAAVFELVAAHGGSISAEHGIGVHKVRYLGLGRDAADRAAMRAIKRALDPAGLLNPGVLFG